MAVAFVIAFVAALAFFGAIWKLSAKGMAVLEDLLDRFERNRR